MDNKDDLTLMLLGQQPRTGIQLEDPELDWNSLRQAFNLSPEEVELLAIPTPGEGGPSLAQRLQAIRPGVTLGNIELQLDRMGGGYGVEGRIRF